MTEPTKEEALESVYGLRRAVNGDDLLGKLKTIQHYIDGSSPAQTHHYDALNKACGGRINPETLRDLYDNRFDEVSWEARAQYYEFMAGMTRMFRPVGEE